MLNAYEVAHSNIVYAGYLERKGTSLIMPWKQRWVVLTTDGLKIHREEDASTFKSDFRFDENTHIAIAEKTKGSIFQTHFVPTQDAHKFCVFNKDGMEELTTYSPEDRNNWVRHISEVIERKTPGGGFVLRVSDDSQFQYLRRWEAFFTTHNIDKSTGMMSFDTVDVEILDPATGQVNIQRRLASATVDDFNFNGFLPFDVWLKEFEPATHAAREQALKERKFQTAKSTGEHMRDYMVDKIVERYTENSTPKACNMLLEGMCELISRSERQLARTYHLTAASAEGKALVPNLPQELAGQQIGAATSVSELQSARILVKGAAGTAPELDTSLDVPLDIQKDILGILSSIRALISTYRFEDNSLDDELHFLRRLAIHRIVYGTNGALLKLQREAEITLDKAAKEAQQAVDDITRNVEESTQQISRDIQQQSQPDSSAAKVQQQTQRLLELQRGGALKEVTKGLLGKEDESLEEGQTGQSQQKEGARGEEQEQEEGRRHRQAQDKSWTDAIRGEVEENLRESEQMGQEQEQEDLHGGQRMMHGWERDIEAIRSEAKGEVREPFELEDRGQAGRHERKVPDLNVEEREQQQDRDFEEKEDGKEEESLSIEQRRDLRRKGAELREKTLERLRGILRPQLTRIKDEMAPLVQNFKERTQVNSEEVEGIAADVTNKVGEAVVQFIERRVEMLEQSITQQLEVVQELVSDLREQGSEGRELSADEVFDKVVRKTGEAQGMHPDEASDAARRYAEKIKDMHAAMQRKVGEFKGRIGAAWYCTDLDTLETVILEHANELHAQLRDLVSKGTSAAMLAMVYLFSTGMGYEKAPVIETPQGDFPPTMPQQLPQQLPQQAPVSRSFF
jgi:hypothetical protein